MKRIFWKNIHKGNEALNVAGVRKSEAGAWRLHDHDFFEIFWVDSGQGWHILSEERQPLSGGDLVFIRPPDAHGFEAVASSEPFSIINVAFPIESWRGLSSRYALNSHPFLRESGQRPPQLAMSADLRKMISILFRDLVTQPRTRLALDAFLLQIALLTATPHSSPPLQRAPSWLRAGLLSAARNPELLEGGPSALAEHCGCSTAHLSRVLRESLDQTPTTWILVQKLNLGCQLLEGTGLSVAEIALESGFGNLSHFHRCFRKAHDQTPLQYRREHLREWM
jgi:AraC family cel operon transcriptional repressor